MAASAVAATVAATVAEPDLLDPLVSASPAMLMAAVTARLAADELVTGPIKASSWAALVESAYAMLRSRLARSVAEGRAEALKRKQAATAWNFRVRALGVLASSGMGWGVNVLPYLRRSIEGRALHATSAELHVACRRARFITAEVQSDAFFTLDCRICCCCHSVRVVGDDLFSASSSSSSSSSSSFAILCVCVCVCANFVLQQIMGEFVLSKGVRGSGLGQFVSPTGLTLTANQEHLLIADWGNARVVIASAQDGESIRRFEAPPYSLKHPRALVVIPRTGEVCLSACLERRERMGVCVYLCIVYLCVGGGRGDVCTLFVCRGREG
jgi:hypothetical protein